MHQGYVHSLETFGTVDGPGTRMVVFTQGCPARCAYCHNPDTWEVGKAGRMTVESILEAFERNRPFYKNGGITVSGGEPLLQPEFVSDLFHACHENKLGAIHTCLDTSAMAYTPKNPARFEELLSACDMVLLDIKHSDPDKHQWLCGVDQARVLAFGDELCKRHIPVIIRHVVVPGITDTDEELAGVGRIIAQWNNVCGLDVLPYHVMGIKKYERLGIPYRLEGVEPMDAKRVPVLREKILQARDSVLSA